MATDSSIQGRKAGAPPPFPTWMFSGWWSSGTGSRSCSFGERGKMRSHQTGSWSWPCRWTRPPRWLPALRAGSPLPAPCPSASRRCALTSPTSLASCRSPIEPRLSFGPGRLVWADGHCCACQFPVEVDPSIHPNARVWLQRRPDSSWSAPGFALSCSLFSVPVYCPVRIHTNPQTLP